MLQVLPTDHFASAQAAKVNCFPRTEGAAFSLCAGRLLASAEQDGVSVSFKLSRGWNILPKGKVAVAGDTCKGPKREQKSSFIFQSTTFANWVTCIPASFPCIHASNLSW